MVPMSFCTPPLFYLRLCSWWGRVQALDIPVSLPAGAHRHSPTAALGCPRELPPSTDPGSTMGVGLTWVGSLHWNSLPSRRGWYGAKRRVPEEARAEWRLTTGLFPPMQVCVCPAAQPPCWRASAAIDTPGHPLWREAEIKAEVSEAPGRLGPGSVLYSFQNVLRLLYQDRGSWGLAVS